MTITDWISIIGAIVIPFGGYIINAEQKRTNGYIKSTRELLESKIKSLDDIVREKFSAQDYRLRELEHSGK